MTVYRFQKIFGDGSAAIGYPVDIRLVCLPTEMEDKEVEECLKSGDLKIVNNPKNKIDLSSYSDDKSHERYNIDTNISVTHCDKISVIGRHWVPVALPEGAIVIYDDAYKKAEEISNQAIDIAKKNFCGSIMQKKYAATYAMYFVNENSFHVKDGKMYWDKDLITKEAITEKFLYGQFELAMIGNDSDKRMHIVMTSDKNMDPYKEFSPIFEGDLMSCKMDNFYEALNWGVRSITPTMLAISEDGLKTMSLLEEETDLLKDSLERYGMNFVNNFNQELKHLTFYTRENELSVEQLNECIEKITKKLES